MRPVTRAVADVLATILLSVYLLRPHAVSIAAPLT